MGDSIHNINNSMIVNRSLVNGSFNKIREEMGDNEASVLAKIAAEIERSGNREAAELFDHFNEELQRTPSRKSILRNAWDGIIQMLPSIAKIADAASTMAKLFK